MLIRFWRRRREVAELRRYRERLALNLGFHSADEALAFLSGSPEVGSHAALERQARAIAWRCVRAYDARVSEERFVIGVLVSVTWWRRIFIRPRHREALYEALCRVAPVHCFVRVSYVVTLFARKRKEARGHLEEIEWELAKIRAEIGRRSPMHAWLVGFVARIQRWLP
jgi:hypothetical protein